MNFIFFIITFIAVISIHGEVEESIKRISFDDVKKLPMKEIKKFLIERNLQCKGCTEKEDYVKLYFENQHIAIIASKEKKIEDDLKNNDDDKEKSQKLKDLMDELKKGGFGGAKMFTKEDMEGMNSESFAQEFGSKNKKKEKRNRDFNNNKKKKHFDTKNELGEQEIEL